LQRRAPGNDPYTSPRKESDYPEILSGVFEGKTTGAPISILIKNQDADPSKYNADVLRPGHAHFAYLQKYGLFDHRGGGRASARETACRVAAGAVAKKLLLLDGIICRASLFNHDEQMARVQKALDEGDSIGGIVEFEAINMPHSLGDPVYEKLEAKLSSAMLSIPASKGFEMGEGFLAATMRGSSHNDLFVKDGDRVVTKTNHAGGTLGGISTGLPIQGRVAFKPASSIKKSQESLNLKGEKADFQLPEGSRHDPCVAIRAVPVVVAMLALVLADSLLLNYAQQYVRHHHR
jgi:chorismate synthase